ncbi:MAG: hypothetical protein CL670_13285 [Balneola sp.]|jgi:hypothetical protein|nr:hypothetical protein [Balneola sp.]MBE80123.1 hypothetical protein [Balneola sp.]HBX65910.1 hypothetical protein [Balneolaceae bacterium]|tara:strand:- start:882 stop:1295 length:414 start_codon:yes stop_codon:yes gene_type:complete
MNHFKRVVLYSSFLIIAFDTVGSFASEFFNFPYSSLNFGSYLIYGIAGFFATKGKDLGKSALAGFIVGLVEATIGWVISWLILTEHHELGISPTVVIILIIIFVSLSGTYFGLIGGAIRKYVGKYFIESTTTDSSKE